MPTNAKEITFLNIHIIIYFHHVLSDIKTLNVFVLVPSFLAYIQLNDLLIKFPLHEMQFHRQQLIKMLQQHHDNPKIKILNIIKI